MKKIFIIFILFIICAAPAFATQTILDNVNITKNLTVGALNAADCDVKANTSGTLYCGIDLTGGGGSGTNYWQIGGSWMWPNITSGGKNSINLTTVNATNFYGSGAGLTSLNTFNSTYDAKVSDNVSWNESRANSLYALIGEPLWSGNYTTFNNSWSNTFNSTYNTWAYNQTTPAISWVQTQNYLTAWIPNTTAEMRTAVNSSGYYNITSQQCYFVNNATERSSFTDTFNSSYDAKVSDNTSWNETHANSLYATKGEPLWSGNYSAFNSSWASTFNLTYNNFVTANISNQSQYSFYVNNDTERNSFTSTFNATYDAKPSSTFNASYNAQLGHNTTGEIQTAINNSGFYNITSNNSNYLSGLSFSTFYNASNPSGYISSYTETDPRWSANASNVLNWNKTYADTLYAVLSHSHTISQSNLSQTFAINPGNVTGLSLGYNTSAQVDAAINATANRYFQLKVNESSYLAGQASMYYLNASNTSVVYKDAGNVSNNSIYLNGQASSYYLNTGGFNAANLTGGTISNIAIVSNQWVNTSTGVNASKVYTPVICGDQACIHNITYNGTNFIIYG